jgi:hypothetical protein
MVPGKEYSVQQDQDYQYDCRCLRGNPVPSGERSCITGECSSVSGREALGLRMLNVADQLVDLLAVVSRLDQHLANVFRGMPVS